MDTPIGRPPWSVLLIGGASGCGKTMASEAIGRRLGVPWLQVDDLRLALQYGDLLTPAQHPDLFSFLQLEDVRRVSPETLRERLSAIADLLGPAISAVIAHHVATDKPVILEGDGIAPALAARERAEFVRAVFLVEPDEETLYRNMLARGRGIAADRTPEANERARAWARLAWRYNAWLHREVRRYRLPAISARPYETLADRILEAVR